MSKAQLHNVATWALHCAQIIYTLYTSVFYCKYVLNAVNNFHACACMNRMYVYMYASLV